MSIYPSLPGFAEAPMSAILRGLNAASPQSLIEPTPFSYEQCRFTACVQEYHCLIATEVPGTGIRQEPRHGFARVRWIEEEAFTPCCQTNSFSAFWRRHTVAGTNETAVDDHVLWHNSLGKSQPLDSSLS